MRDLLRLPPWPILGIVLSLPAQAAQVDDFAYAAAIELSASAPFQRVELPPQVYRSLTDGALADLRVFNGAGEIVPHAFEPRALTSSLPARPTEVPLFVLGTAADSGRALNLRVETSDDGTVISLHGESGRARGPAAAWLVDASQLGQRIQALELSLVEPERQFSGRMRVEASNDLAQWRTLVASAPLLQLAAEDGEIAQLRIEWPATQARYLRLTWSGAPPAGLRERVFASVRVEPVPQPQEAARSWLSLAAPEVREVGGRQELIYALPGAVPTDRVRIALPQPNSVVGIELFARARKDAQWRSLGRHQLYRLSEGGEERRNPDIHAQPVGELMLRVDARGGGFGSGLPALDIGWVPHRLVFAARGEGPFTLAWGRHNASPGDYPIASLVPGYGRDDGSPPAIADARLGEARSAGGEERLRAPVDARRLMLWSVLVGAVLILALMAWRMSRLIQSSDDKA